MKYFILTLITVFTLTNITLHLAKNKSFTIEAKNFSEQAIYNNTRFLNGKKINTPVITYRDVSNGGLLTFEMVNN